MIDYALILVTNYPGTQWSVGDTYDSLQWLDKSPKPTQDELEALWESTQAALIAKQKAAEKTKASALAKLTKLGLTADEITALTGN